MARIKYYNAGTASWEYADTGAGIDDSKFSSTTTYSSQKIEAELNDIENKIPTVAIATETTAGLVKPVVKTDEMTQAIGVDEVGKLWGTAGSNGLSEITLEMELKEEAQVLEVDIPLEYTKLLSKAKELAFYAYIVRPSEGSTDATKLQNVKFGIKHPNYYSFQIFIGDVGPVPSISYIGYTTIEMFKTTVLDREGFARIPIVTVKASPQNVGAVTYTNCYDGRAYYNFHTFRLECATPMGVGTYAYMIARY